MAFFVPLIWGGKWSLFLEPLSVKYHILEKHLSENLEACMQEQHDILRACVCANTLPHAALQLKIMVVLPSDILQRTPHAQACKTPTSIQALILHPHLLGAIVDNEIRNQPILPQGAPLDVLKPIIATHNASHSIQEHRVAIPHGRALTKNNFVVVGLEDGLVVVNALA